MTRNISILLTSALLILSCASPKYIYDESEIFSEVREAVFTLSDDQMMGRETGTQGELLAAKYIMGEYVQIGLQAFPTLGGYLQPFTFTANPHFEAGHGHPQGTGIGHNIVGYIDNNKDEWVVLGAHYDHLGMGGPYSRAPDVHEIHNGADDNASGVASILGIARRLRYTKLDFNVLFVAFSGEEFGLWGSKHFIDELPIAQASIRYMINLDMVGRMSAEKEVVAYGTGTTPHWDDLLEKSNVTLDLDIVKQPSGSGPSDHASFYNKEIPVLFFFTGQHEDYHTPSDDAEKINLKGIVQITELVGNVIVQSQDYPNMPFQKTKDPETKQMSFNVTMGVMPDYVYQGKGMRIDGTKSDRPASNAGLIKGDIVIKIGDHVIDDIYAYMKVLGEYQSGDSTTVTIIREGQEITLPLTW